MRPGAAQTPLADPGGASPVAEAALDLVAGGPEAAQLLRLRARPGGIGEGPMQPLGAAEEDRADLLRAERDHRVHARRVDAVDELGALAHRVDPLLGQHPEGDRVHRRRRLAAGALDPHPIAEHRAGQPLGDLAARGVGDAEEEHPLHGWYRSSWMRRAALAVLLVLTGCDRGGEWYGTTTPRHGPDELWVNNGGG